MDQHHDPKLIEPPVNEERRRLAKAGLAAPAVLGVLASRPVLGAPPHHCTVSGMLSGNTSPTRTGAGVDCHTLGHGPSHYAVGPSAWPDGSTPGTDFINNNGRPRPFRNTPWSLSVRFANAYQRRNTSNNNISDATVWDVLKGQPVNNNTGNPLPNQVLEARPGFLADLELGAEAVAAFMNATQFAPNFPLTREQVVAMFNAVANGGLYTVNSSVQWDASQVKAYWQSLHP